MKHRTRILIASMGALALVATVHAQASTPPTFAVPVALAGGGGGEPLIATDRNGTVAVSAPQGLGFGAINPGEGGGAYWVSHDHGATWPTTPQFLGGPSGGGDEDDVFAPDTGQLYIADLAASHSTVCSSTDHGFTFNAVGPVPDPLNCKATPLGAVSPSSDRQWLTADVGGRAYLTDHEFVSAQPRAWTTTDGGFDQFAVPCGSIVSDPTIEANVPQDITGGTLVSKPVVDSAGRLYVLFTTTTQTQNATAYGKGIIAGTFSQAYLAVSIDHCLTFTDYTVFNGAALGADTVQFGDIFNDLAIDPAGNLYVVAAGFIGTTPFAATADVYLFTSPAASHGSVWSTSKRVTTDVGAHMLPAAVAGPNPGDLAIGYFRTTNGSTDANKTSDTWAYTVAETTNALGATPAYQFVDMNGGKIYHHGDICNSGVLCGTGAPGTGSDRSLLDFSSAAMDSDGCPFFAFAGNPSGDNTGSATYVTKQRTGCFATAAANTSVGVPVPSTGLGSPLGAPALAALLGGALAVAASDAMRRRSRRQ